MASREPGCLTITERVGLDSMRASAISVLGPGWHGSWRRPRIVLRKRFAVHGGGDVHRTRGDNSSIGDDAGQAQCCAIRAGYRHTVAAAGEPIATGESA
jgi:hypothetical protein